VDRDLLCPHVSAWTGIGLLAAVTLPAAAVTRFDREEPLVTCPLSAVPAPPRTAALTNLRDDHATVAGLHSFADLPQPVSLLLCDALIEWAFLIRHEPPPRPPAPHADVEQVLRGIAARLVDTISPSTDVATKLAVGRVARHLGLAARALRDGATLRQL
jgi:hypothetical protein